MRKLTLLIILVITFTSVYSQNDKSKKIKTSYLHIPDMDATRYEPKNMTIEFVSQAVIFSKESLKDVKTTCKNNATGKAQEVTTYYYEVAYTSPESFVIGRDVTGATILAIKVSDFNELSTTFGYQECKNFLSANLKKKWASNAAAFKSKIENDEINKLYDEAKTKTKQSIYPFYLPMEIEIYYAKGKEIDYTDLDNAFEWATNAAKKLNNDGMSATVKEDFEKCLAIWEKELATADIENKDARINKDIAKGLHENCVYAYTLIYNFDKAMEHGRQFKMLFGNYSNNRTAAMDNHLAFTRLQSIRAESNAGIVANIEAMDKLAKEFDKKDVDLQKADPTSFDSFAEDYAKFSIKQNTIILKDMKKQEDELIAQGEINPYEKFVTRAANGNSVYMNFPPSSFSGIPELTSFPKEICELEDIKQVLIVSNKIASITSEIGKMKDLKILNLSSNALTNLPPEIGQLTKLEKLILNNNPIIDFPMEIGQLKSLKKLDLRNTKLSAEQQKTLQELLPDCKISF